jgi:hypothetical protein
MEGVGALFSIVNLADPTVGTLGEPIGRAETRRETLASFRALKPNVLIR